MREINFRGRCVLTREWLHGGLIQLENVTRICWINENNVFCSAVVDKNTLTQYTGLRDKNGKKIYEGDIVDYGADPSVVVFEDGCFWARRCQYALFHNSQSDLEVLGNIYENPELLNR